MLRLTNSERAAAEVAATAEHVASLTAAASACGLSPDVPASHPHAPPPLVPLLDQTQAPEAAETLQAVAGWAAQSLGIDHVPAIWRALAHQPRLLAATWRKDRVVMAAGALDLVTKLYAALAVAQFRGSNYWIAYFTQQLRRAAGLDDRQIVEVAGAVMHYVSFNTIAHGMRLGPTAERLTAADVAEGGPLEHLLPPPARKRRV